MPISNDPSPFEEGLALERALFQRCAFYDAETETWSRDNHWKGPLRVVVEQDEVDAMRHAILGFVGGVDRKEELEDGLVILASLGYYHHIGA